MDLEMCKEALDVQNACNLSGICHGLARRLPAIWEEARAMNKGTEYVNTHPVVVLFLAQMVHLAKAGCIDPQAYHKAYEACEAVVKLE